MKILLLDLEISPNIVHTWGLHNQFIAINQIVEPSKTLCWAAKWLGSDEVMFSSVHKCSERQMIKEIYSLLNEADCLVTFNGDSFDLKILNRDFIKHELTPPKPAQTVDLLKIVRKNFRFPSNKMAYVCKELGLGEKTQHEGHELWTKCMADDHDAWVTMEEYNKNDIVLTEKLYELVKGWINHHPNHGLFTESNGRCCPNCGGVDLSPRGYRYTKTLKYRRYKCRDKTCGKWSSSRLSESRSNKNLLV